MPSRAGPGSGGRSPPWGPALGQRSEPRAVPGAPRDAQRGLRAAPRQGRAGGRSPASPPRPSAGAEPAAGGHLGEASTEQTPRAAPVRGALGCEGGRGAGQGLAQHGPGGAGAEARAGGSCCYWGGTYIVPSLSQQLVSASNTLHLSF